MLVLLDNEKVFDAEEEDKSGKDGQDEPLTHDEGSQDCDCLEAHLAAQEPIRLEEVKGNGEAAAKQFLNEST